MRGMLRAVKQAIAATRSTRQVSRRTVPVLTALIAACAWQPSLGGGLVAAEVDEGITATRADQIRELLSEGVRLFQIGRFDEAALRLKDAMLLAPEDRLLYEFYLAMGDKLLIRMQERAELSDVMSEILRKARIYQTTLRRDPRYIDLLISKLRASEKERLAATLELVAVGPIAVPQLIEKIGDNKQEDYRVWCRMVLTRMGYRAVIPLTEALNSSDERQQQSVATILADIADPRALPRLQEIIETESSTDTTRRVCRNTVAAIAAKAGLTDVPDSRTLYFQEGLRYFRDGDQVRDELIANESLLWRWNQDAGEQEYQLQYVIAPSYAWNELIAEELIYDGARQDPDYAGFYPLLAATFAAQDVEATERAEMAKDRTVPARTPDDEIDALEERKQALVEVRYRLAMFGAPHLYRAVQQAIVSERYDTAIYLMRRLQDNFVAGQEAHLPSSRQWNAQPEQLLPDQLEGLSAEKAGAVLVAALDHPEKRIRYQAAITLAHLDPDLEFFNRDKVVPLLSDAVGEWGMLAVLVIEPDPRHRNTARHQLMNQGMLAFTANDGFQATQRLGQAPFKDAVVISGLLKPALRDEHGVVIDVDEQTVEGMIRAIRANEQTSQVPIFIALPDQKDLADKLQTAFGGVEGLTGFVHQPYNGVEIKGVVEQALGDSELPEVNRRKREDISLRAAQALGAIDVSRSQFDLAEAAEALAANIANRDDPIRIASLIALGHTGAAGKVDYVTEVYGAQAETLAGKPEVRAAFLYCIGRLNPKTPAAQAILLEAMNAAEDQVRRQAEIAIGYDTELPHSDRLKALLQQRPDVRTAGNGQAAAPEAN